eukprot:TRINITY_DN14252_c0_g1_i1.p1 TRINITY_DN14252_c0_g1~~TRINITY_DN14252_c0_g1_i1.p1  ORF type:complete len:191 (-),score=22.97 TRINITY_DN14252_c0_g1_i1:36-608(-)
MNVLYISNWIRTRCYWRSLIILVPLLIFFLWRITTFAESINTEDLPVLDLRMGGYTADETSIYLNAIGPSGRDILSKVYTHGYDVIYPIMFTSILIVFMSKVFKADSSIPTVNLMPLLVFIFDMSENVCIHHLATHPQVDQSFSKWVSVSSTLTQAKWTAFFLCVLFIVIGAINNLFSKTRYEIQKEKIK